MSNITDIISNSSESSNTIKLGYGNTTSNLTNSVKAQTNTDLFQGSLKSTVSTPIDKHIVDYEDATVTNYVLSSVIVPIVSSIVPKLEYIADKYETTKSAENSIVYIDAALARDSYGSYSEFEVSVIQSVFESEGQNITLELATYYAQNPKVIPQKYRDGILKAQRNYVLDNYIEWNTYYRELNGKPPLVINPITKLPQMVDGSVVIDSTECLTPLSFLTLDQIKSDYNYLDKIDPDTGIEYYNEYIYLLPQTTLALMDTDGLISSIIKSNPDKRWLQHLINPISYLDSRLARNFDILYVDKIDDSICYTNFISIYYQVRTYIIECIYDKGSLGIDGPDYDGFIGMLILTLTLQRLMVSYMDVEISRNFFNKELIKMYFKSYNMPFFSDTSIDNLNTICRKLNLMLLYKSTNYIFNEIFDLFDLPNTTVYKYYLFKHQHVDSDGRAIWVEPITEPAPNATDAQVYAYENAVYDRLNKMYYLDFVKIPINETSLGTAILDSDNYISYDQVVDSDPLWGNKSNPKGFMNKVLSAKFNYVETKYISMTSLYEFDNIINYSTYLFNAIFNLKEYDNFSTTINNYSSYGSFTIFEIIIGLYAGVSSLLNFDGNILNSVTQNMSIMGFNFDSDLDIQSLIDGLNEYNTLYGFSWSDSDGEVVPGTQYSVDSLQITQIGEGDLNISNGNFSSASDMWTFFTNQLNTKSYIAQLRANASTIEEWRTFNTIYEAYMTTTRDYELLKNSDGTMPSTWMDYLKTNSPAMYKILKSLTSSTDMSKFVSEILQTLENLFDENAIGEIPIGSSQLVKAFVYYLINIFKSYTVDLIGMDAEYMFDNKDLYFAKLIDEINFLNIDTTYGDKIDITDGIVYENILKVFYDNIIKTRHNIIYESTFDGITSNNIGWSSLSDNIDISISDNSMLIKNNSISSYTIYSTTGTNLSVGYNYSIDIDIDTPYPFTLNVCVKVGSQIVNLLENLNVESGKQTLSYTFTYPNLDGVPYITLEVIPKEEMTLTISKVMITPNEKLFESSNYNGYMAGTFGDSYLSSSNPILYDEILEFIYTITRNDNLKIPDKLLAIDHIFTLCSGSRDIDLIDEIYNLNFNTLKQDNIQIKDWIYIERNEIKND